MYVRVNSTPSGAQAFDFNWAYSPESVGDEEIVELTYLPTCQTRWYDVSHRHWAGTAVQDFKEGKFAVG
jgi:hypothetical protein